MDKFTPNARYRAENYAFIAIVSLGAALGVLAVLSLIFGW